MKTPFLFPVFLGLVSMALAGCEGSRIYNDERYNVTFQQQHPIVVEKKAQDLVISVSDVKKGFSVSEEDRFNISNFAKTAHNKRAKTVHIIAPSGGQNDGNMNKAVEQVQSVLKASGMETVEIQRPVVSFDSLPPLRLSYEQYVATPPNCSGAWSRNTADAYRNTRWLGLGCSTQSNFATMLSNPRDLIEMQPMDGGYGARRERAIGNFQEGNSTSASRSADETASASASSL